MNGNGLRASIADRQIQHDEALIGDVFQVLAHLAARQADDAARRARRPRTALRTRPLLRSSSCTCCAHSASNSCGLFAPHGVEHFECERHVRALIAEHPVRAGGKARQQPARTQEVHVGKSAEEEQAFDAGREAGEIQQKATLVGIGLEMLPSENTSSVQRWQNSALRRIDGMLSIAAKACGAPLLVGHVVVEQRQIELDVQRFLDTAAATDTCALRAH